MFYHSNSSSVLFGNDNVCDDQKSYPCHCRGFQNSFCPIPSIHKPRYDLILLHSIFFPLDFEIWFIFGYFLYFSLCLFKFYTALDPHCSTLVFPCYIRMNYLFFCILGNVHQFLCLKYSLVDSVSGPPESFQVEDRSPSPISLHRLEGMVFTYASVRE